jgi:hypothetical protein
MGASPQAGGDDDDEPEENFPAPWRTDPPSPPPAAAPAGSSEATRGTLKKEKDKEKADKKKPKADAKENPKDAKEKKEKADAKTKEDRAIKLKGQRVLLGMSTKPNASAEQKALGIAYRAESRGSTIKDALLNNFLADKSCRWHHEAVDSHLERTARSDSSLHGHGSRYDVAGLLNLREEIPEQKALLDCVCSELLEEGEWDDTNAIERSYKKLGYKRYRIDRKELSKWEKTDLRTEGVSSTKAYI